MKITKSQLKRIIKEELEEVSRDQPDVYGRSPLQSLANEMQGTIEAASSGGVNSMEELLPILARQIERLQELASAE